MKSLLLNVERLRRHYESAVKTYDEVSLLDLSHSLRLWTELKDPLKEISPKFSSAQVFKTAIPARKVLKAARGHRYVFSYMPGGVVTYASNGSLVEGPDIGGKEDKSSLGIAFKVSDEYIELGKFSAVSTNFDQSLIRALSAESVTRCNFVQWMGAEVVRVCYKEGNGELTSISISREMIIKRVANTLDGSHPSLAGTEDDENTFDKPVHHLLQYKIGGLPLPYFILLKIAQDILDKTPKLVEEINQKTER